MRRDDSLAALQKYVGMLPPIKLTVNEFAKRKTSNEQWYSSSFYTHLRGYKMCLRVDANGCGDGKGTHVSVYAYLIRGEYDDLLQWPFQGSIVVQLCNQLEDKHHCTDTIDFSETADPEVISRVTNGERAEAGWGISTLNWLEVNNHTTRTIIFADNESTGEVTDEEQAGGMGYSTFITHSDLKYSSIKNSQYLPQIRLSSFSNCPC